MYFKVNYTKDDANPGNATATLNVKVYQQPTFSGDASWINDYQASRDDHTHTITLTKYNGTQTDLSIPATVKINNVDYQIVLSGDVYKHTGITSISFNSYKRDDGTVVSVKASDSLKELFAYCVNLKKVDLRGLNTENVTDMSYMFEGDYFLKYVGVSDDSNQVIFSGDGSQFTTKNVVTMEGMFMNMSDAWLNKVGLTKLDVSSFDTTNLKETKLFAAWNSYLEEVNLSSFNGAISNDAANDANTPLRGNDALTKLTLGENWHARDYKTYSSLGIDGNWKYIGPNKNFKNVVFSNEETNTNFYKDMAGIYEKTNEAPSSASRPLYVADGYVKEGNMWEVHTPQNTFHGYCLDHNRLAPSGYFDKVAIEKDVTSNTSDSGVSNYIMDYLDEGNTGYKELGNNMTEALIALIYWSEYGGHNGQYDQDDIWHFTNDYSSGISAKLKAKIVGHTYNDIPDKEKYNLYIYVPSELNLSPEKDQMQNLLSIEGANDQAYAGVQVKKVDNTSSKAPVGGATFAVYHANADGTKDTTKKFGNGEDHLEFTTNSAGIGGIYRMDRTVGLTVGKYILEEISAPTGYLKNNTSFMFDVTESDNQKMISVGNSDGVIVDDIEDKYVGGGITLKKVDSTSGKPLPNATFTLYETDKSGKILNDASGKPVYSKTYTTDETGVLKTGLKDLEIGKYYIVKETAAPEGYDINQKGTGKPYQSVVIHLRDGENDQYKDIGAIENVPQTVEVQLYATKVFDKISLSENKFTFKLYDSQNNLIDTQQNDDTGKVTFKKMTLSAADMPGKDYYIVEEDESKVKPSINGQTITYDQHKEAVKVLLQMNPDTDKLESIVKYDSDGAIFVNRLNVKYDGKLNIHKTVTNSSKSDDTKFDFNLEIQSPSADLAARDFHYTFDGKTVYKFKFNKISSKTEDNLYRYKTPEGTFKLKDQSTLQLLDLPVGAKYVVSEEETRGYILVNSENTNGTITENVTTASFTNEAQSIIPTSADTMTHMSFWLIASASAIVLVWILKRKLKVSKK
ncbi:SpaA isopeptide-forming pilin-related protein [Sharpea azabuensis]|uniref:SpaA isopeptide-forming pilin-related protein n=1 Tax=Sharpea azabuensis TaxID=322505 RepID=UPI00051B4A18|nr:SpaA isopeptide-forming pilin-related protein [Sharpea azabuensis]